VRELDVGVISDQVARMCQEANFDLPEDVLARLEWALKEEESPAGREVLGQILENARVAAAERVPMCQDTGAAVVFVEVGQDVHLVGGSLRDAIDEGVRKGYTEGYLRKSMVADPLRRLNTGDNTPAIVHERIVPGDRVRLVVAPKGGGSENMSRIGMLTPAAGREGVVRFVVDAVREAGPNPCPPVVVGVGLGGTFEVAALLSKKAAVRRLGEHNEDPELARLEEELLERVNALGVGPQGFGGRVTALWVSVESYPCHITALPVAVNMNCHACRHVETVI